jgi:membrane fusion protein, heavy metal efflux system
MISLRFALRLTAFAAALHAAPVLAHEGHDHGEAPKPIIVSDKPTLEASSADFELAGITDGKRIILHLDRTTTNRPVLGASVEAMIGGATVAAAGGADGVYRLELPAPLPPGGHDFTFTVAADDVADLLVGAVNIPAAGAPSLTAAAPPRRLPDGSLYVPKATQHLLEVRTVVAATQEATRTAQLIGQVAPDPNGGGHVQATQSGRIEPGEHGLPYVGQRVEAGQVLAYVAPAVNVVDRSGIQQQIALVEQELTIAEARLARLRKLEGSVPQREIDEAETTLRGFERRRAALSPTLTVKEALRAPISGVVAANNVKAGQVVDSRDQVLFEIVDPARLMVEASAFDPKVADSQGTATATTGDGALLRLERVGSGIVMKQQAIALHYRIVSPPPGLVIGLPVRIIVQLEGTTTGVVVPRKSVTRGPGGLPVVWRHDSALRFVAHPVRFEPVDSENVVIVAGVEPGARIVADGAGLLNQVR